MSVSYFSEGGRHRSLLVFTEGIYLCYVTQLKIIKKLRTKTYAVFLGNSAKLKHVQEDIIQVLQTF